MENKGGRPTVMTENTVRILEDAFSNGATDIEACFLAGISKQSLYDYQKKHPEFTDRKAALKEMTKYKAKQVVRKKIEEGDEKTATWFLERKGKDEGYSLRQEITGAGGKEIPQPILYAIFNNNSNAENSKDDQEDKSDSRGDISVKDNQHIAVLDSLGTDRQEADTD